MSLQLQIESWPPFPKGMQVGTRVGVRAVYVPTGISAAVDCDRRQYRNKTMAVALVKAMVSANNG